MVRKVVEVDKTDECLQESYENKVIGSDVKNGHPLGRLVHIWVRNGRHTAEGVEIVLILEMRLLTSIKGSRQTL